jgi:predicted phage terminase large subunit-like protein
VTAEQEVLGLARLDFAAFCVAMRPDYKFPRFLLELIDNLEAVEKSDLRRLLVFMPPRHGKTLTGSILFAAWAMGRDPKRFVVLGCYGEELAFTFGRAIRNVMASALFRQVFSGCRLAGDSTAANRFALEAGGGFFAVGRGSALTGRGASILILDDLVKDRAEADSEAVRRSTESWLREVAITRLEPRSPIVAIGTRWHQADILGTLAADRIEPWKTLAFPAIAEKGDPLQRPEGEALWPERFGLTELARIRAEIGSRAWSALYQGRPTAAEGAVFRIEWIQRYSSAPTEFSRIVLAVDCAFKGGTENDFSAATVWGESKTGFYLLFGWRDRPDFPALKRRIIALAEAWNPHAVLIEDAASGQSAIQELLSGTSLPIVPVKATGGKTERAVAVSPMFESGRVHFPAPGAGWLADLEDELLAFPAGIHDDLVDSVSMALNFLRQRPVDDAVFRPEDIERAFTDEVKPLFPVEAA